MTVKAGIGPVFADVVTFYYSGGIWVIIVSSSDNPVPASAVVTNFTRDDAIVGAAIYQQLRTIVVVHSMAAGAEVELVSLGVANLVGIPCNNILVDICRLYTTQTTAMHVAGFALESGKSACPSRRRSNE